MYPKWYPKLKKFPWKFWHSFQGIPAKGIKEHQGQSTATSLQKSKGTNGCRFGKLWNAIVVINASRRYRVSSVGFRHISMKFTVFCGFGYIEIISNLRSETWRTQ